MTSTDQEQLPDPELVIGLVTPVGTNTAAIADSLKVELGKWNYQTSIVRLTDYFNRLEPAPLDEHEDERIQRLIQKADDFCRQVHSKEAMAALAIVEIGQIRIAHHRASPRSESCSDDESDDKLVTRPLPRHAYVIHSLKRPEEVVLLRLTYGPQFILLGAQLPWEQRISNLASRYLSAQDDAARRECAEQLMRLDEDEIAEDYGQRVNACFPLADYFLSSDASPDRFVGLVFGKPIAPTPGELAMYLARATSKGSLSAHRRVGATIVAGESIIAVGRNDVPAGEDPDIETQGDSSELLKRGLLTDTLKRLALAGLLSEEVTDELTTRADAALQGSELASIIEFQRPIHAEVAAISDAAARGQVVRDTTLYCTTYPCHLCFKAALAAQIKEIRYIEPYPKSRATAMYPKNAQRLKPYEGIAPSMYLRAFEGRPESVPDSSGRFPRLDPMSAQPILPNRKTIEQVGSRESKAAKTIPLPDTRGD